MSSEDQNYDVGPPSNMNFSSNSSTSYGIPPNTDRLATYRYSRSLGPGGPRENEQVFMAVSQRAPSQEVRKKGKVETVMNRITGRISNLGGSSSGRNRLELSRPPKRSGDELPGPSSIIRPPQEPASPMRYTTEMMPASSPSVWDIESAGGSKESRPNFLARVEAARTPSYNSQVESVRSQPSGTNDNELNDPARPVIGRNLATVQLTKDMIASRKWEIVPKKGHYSCIVDPVSGAIQSSIQCNHCGNFYANSDHINRHVRDACSGFKQPTLQAPPTGTLNNYQKNELSNLLTKYVVKEGRSFNSAQSDNMLELVQGILQIAGLEVPPNIKLLPSDKTVAKNCYKYATELIKETAREVSLVAQRGELSLAIDHGRHYGSDYLCVFAIYLKNVNGKLKRINIPIGFAYTMESKDAINTGSLLAEVLNTVGVKEELLQNIYVVSDGATALGKMAREGYRGSIRCANHSLNLVGGHVLEPYSDHRREFDAGELGELQTVKKLLATCRDIVTTVRGSGKLRHLCGGSKPRKPAETRWMSNYYLIEDIRKVAAKLDGQVEGDLARNIKDVIKNQDRLKSLSSILEPLVIPTITLQSQNDINIHLVANYYYSLETRYEDLMKNDRNQDVRLFAKSAYHTVRKHIKENLDELHFAALMLNPLTRKMSRFPPAWKTKAKKFIKDLMSQYQDEEVPERTASIKHDTMLLEDSDDEVLKDELEDYIASRPPKDTDIETFWAEYGRIQYPRLHKAATIVLGCSASEAICEQAFSVLKNVVPSNRTNLKEENVETIMLARLIAQRNAPEENASNIDDFDELDGQESLPLDENREEHPDDYDYDYET